MSRCWWLVTFVVGCGRIAFDPLGDGSDSGRGDAPPADADPFACTRQPPQPAPEVCSDGIDSNCNGMDEPVPPEDGPDYNSASPGTLCINCSGFDGFDMSCGRDDFAACGVSGGRDTFFPLIATWNGPLLITIGTPTFAATAGIYTGDCATVVATAPVPIACTHACSDGSPEINITVTNGTRYCVIVEQASSSDLDLRATFTFNPASTVCP